MVELTKSERDFLEVAMTCLKGPPEIDVAKIAETLNIKNKSVTNKWWEIKKKLWPNSSGRGAGDSGKRKRTTDVDDNDDEDNPPTPSKAAPKQPAHAKKAQPAQPETPVTSLIAKTQSKATTPAVKMETVTPLQAAAVGPAIAKIEHEDIKFEADIPTGVNFGMSPPPARDPQLPALYGEFDNYGVPANYQQHPAYHNGMVGNHQQPSNNNGHPGTYQLRRRGPPPNYDEDEDDFI